MDFQAYDFHFEAEKSPFETRGEVAVFDIRLRLGNMPIVKNLYRLFKLKQEKMPADLQVLYQQKDLYSVVHAISTVSKGAKISELIYDAEIVGLSDAQTIELIPNTRFHELLSANASGEIALSASGHASAEVPKELSELATYTSVDFGGGMQLKTAVDGGLSGKFSFSVKYPVVQSMGISSNKCTWILNPDNEKPLNGDQLLVQIIAVPRGTKQLMYRIQGEITADKGFFWKEKTQKTDPMIITVNL